jgi:peptidylprolyl isomerase
MNLNRTLLLPFAASLALGATLLGACGGDTAASSPTKAVTSPTKAATTTASTPTKAVTSPTKAATTAPATSAQTSSTSKLEPYVLTNPTTTPSGLKYQDEVVGTGASPATGKNVTVHYTGKLVNGTKFDSSVDRGQPFDFIIGVGQVIKGWDEGVMTMKVGGKRLLYIPAALAYGSRSPGAGIPANADLTFEVELLAVQ